MWRLKHYTSKLEFVHGKGIFHKELVYRKTFYKQTFGFWTSLFNKQYARLFWRPLMFAFKELDNKQKQRDKIAYKINQIRKFRNRIFHYEPICNDLL